MDICMLEKLLQEIVVNLLNIFIIFYTFLVVTLETGLGYSFHIACLEGNLIRFNAHP